MITTVIFDFFGVVSSEVAAAEALGIRGTVFESADKLRCDLSDLGVKI